MPRRDLPVDCACPTCTTRCADERTIIEEWFTIYRPAGQDPVDLCSIECVGHWSIAMELGIDPARVGGPPRVHGGGGG